MKNVASLLPGLIPLPLPDSFTRDRVFHVVVPGVAILRIVAPGALPVPVLDKLVEEKIKPTEKLSTSGPPSTAVGAQDAPATSLPPCQVEWVDSDMFRLNVDLVRKCQALAAQDTENEESFIVFDPYPHWRSVQAGDPEVGRNLGFPPVLTEGISCMI